MKFEKRNGEIIRKENLIREIESKLMTIRNGKYKVSIQRDVQKRTVNQNALMWMWFTCLEKETGQSKDDFHEYYCRKFLKKLSPIDGQMVVGGTSKLDTVAFTDFLNKVQSDASIEFGVTLPTPDDLYWEEFENYYKRFI